MSVKREICPHSLGKVRDIRQVESARSRVWVAGESVTGGIRVVKLSRVVGEKETSSGNRFSN